MMAANVYANADDAADYAGKPSRPATDADLLGLGPRYRLYPTADGWLFLAAPGDAEWTAATTVLGTDDPGPRLLERRAAEWEALFVAAGVAGIRADAASPGNAFAHDEQVLANDFTPLTSHTRFGDVSPVGTGGTRRRWSAGRRWCPRRRADRRDPRRHRPHARADHRPAQCRRRRQRTGRLGLSPPPVSGTQGARVNGIATRLVER